MRIHVLAGASGLLLPDPLPARDLPALIGPSLDPPLRIATAFWLSPRCGRFTHDFLLASEAREDGRLAVFARSLADNFGRRFEPLIVLPELMDEAARPGVSSGASSGASSASGSGSGPAARRSQAAIAAIGAIWRALEGADLALHALALPGGIDAGDGWAARDGLVASRLSGRLDGIRAHLAATGCDPARIEIAVTEIRPGGTGFAALLRNGIANQVLVRAAPRLAGLGLDTEAPALPRAVARVLADWQAAGIVPALPLGAAGLEALADRVLERLLAGAPADA